MASVMESPRYGLQRGLPFASYLALPAVNHSILRLFSRSPAHARQEMLHPSEPTEAQELGQAFHAAILEPDRFREDYVVAPKVDRRTRIGKETWAAFEAEHASRILLSADDYQACAEMMAAAWSHESLGPLLQMPAISESVIVWRDEETGTDCKARPDRMIQAGETFVLDFKTTQDARSWAFGAAAAKYGYHTQQAFYREGLNVLAPRDRRFIIVAIEKGPHHGICLHEFEPVSVEQGHNDNRRHLRAYKRAVETNHWPSYPPDIQTLSLPAYAIHTEEWEA